MARWPRFRRDQDAPKTSPKVNTAPRRQARLDNDLAKHLSGAAWERPPSAEELKDAFRKKRRTPEPEENKSEFTEQFSSESLFVKAGEILDDDRDLDPSAEADSATRPVDYYYDPADPWRTLDIEPDAEWNDVVSAHRRMALSYHPDRLTDATDEEREAAEDRIREINIAYSSIKRRLGR